MKRIAIIAAATAFAATLPAQGAWWPFHRTADTYAAHSTLPADWAGRPVNNIHAGGANPADDALARRVADAVAQDWRANGADVTIVANNGSISLAGSATNQEQAARVEQIAASFVGRGRVSGTLDQQGAS